MSEKGWDKSGSYGGGYLSQKRHPRNAMSSFGFALVTAAAAFSAALTVPAIAQSQVTGYKYPAHTIRHTQPQDGWQYTASIPFDGTITVAPTGQLSQSYRLSFKRKPPIVTPDDLAWSGSLTALYAPARSLDSQRPKKVTRLSVDQPDTAWLYTASTPVAFDPQYSPRSTDERLRDRYKKVPRLDQPSDTSFVVAQAASLFPELFPRTNTPETFLAHKRFDRPGYPALDWFQAWQAWGIESARPVHRSRLVVDQPDTVWIYTNLPVTFDAAQFQNISGERPYAYHRYRYDGYPNTDWIYQNLPVADVWDASKFQNNLWQRTPKRLGLDVRYQQHEWFFALVDARDIVPSVEQLAGSFRMAVRNKRPILTHDDLAWIFANLQPFDARLVIHTESPTRMAERPLLDVRLQQFYNDLAWLHDVIPLTDPTPPTGQYRVRIIRGNQAEGMDDYLTSWFG